jgi:hypothetical protein
VDVSIISSPLHPLPTLQTTSFLFPPATTDQVKNIPKITSTDIAYSSSPILSSPIPSNSDTSEAKVHFSPLVVESRSHRFYFFYLIFVLFSTSVNSTTS